jgi:DNA-binding winged helix-turn-helix (wHTH) protein
VVKVDFPPTVFPGAPVRARALQRIVDALRQNHCCAVVGPSNTGKSYLLKSLLEEEVRRACSLAPSTQTGAEVEHPSPPLMVFVDFLRPVESEPAFYELLLRSIGSELRQLDLAGSLVEKVGEQRRELLRSSTPMAARAWFDEAIYALCQGEDIRVVLVMDEFDPAFKALPAAPFQELRVLRDEVGDRLMYVTGTSRHLGDIRSDGGTSEFRELFDLHTCVLRPMSTEDSERFVAFVEAEQGTSLGDDHRRWAIDLSGGHPGLLERICHILMDEGESLGASRGEVLRALNDRWPIQEECRRLWEELEGAEQEGLLAVVDSPRSSLDPSEAQSLLAKGLIVRPLGSPWVVFSAVLGAFVQAQLDQRRQSVPRGLAYNAETKQLAVDGRDITRELSAEQYDLLVYLCMRPGVVCSKDDIARAVWPEDWAAGIDITDAQIYQLVKRVRLKVEWDPSRPRYVTTVRGRGYRFEPHQSL